jgi:hypothetical protein
MPLYYESIKGLMNLWDQSLPDLILSGYIITNPLGIFVFFLDTGSHFVALASNSKSSYLNLSSARIRGMGVFHNPIKLTIKINHQEKIKDLLLDKRR